MTERQVVVVRPPEINTQVEGKTWELNLDEMDVVDEDWLAGVSCNPDEPEMCESCQ